MLENIGPQASLENVRELIAQVDLTTHLAVEWGPVQEGYEVAGEVSDDLKRLLLLSTDRYKEMIESVDSHNRAAFDHWEKCHGREDDTLEDDLACISAHEELDKSEEECRRLMDNLDNLRRIFWDNVRLEFPEIAGRDVKIANQFTITHRARDPVKIVGRVHVGISRPNLN